MKQNITRTYTFFISLRTGWAKLNAANAVSFVVENFDNFWHVK